MIIYSGKPILIWFLCISTALLCKSITWFERYSIAVWNVSFQTKHTNVIDAVESQVEIAVEFPLKEMFIQYLRDWHDYVIHCFDHHMSMKGITVGLIVDNLVNDTIEGRQYPAILMSIICDALAIRGAVVSNRLLSTTFRFSGPNEVHECRDADVVCLTADTYCYGLMRRKRNRIVYCPLLDHFFRQTMGNSRWLRESNVILGKDLKGICVQ